MLQKIKQTFNRTKQRVQQTFGKATKTEDDEYAAYKAEFRDMDKYYYKMHRAIKHYHDSLRTMGLAAEELARETTNFYQPGAPHERAAREFTDVMTQIENSCKRSTDGHFHDEVLKPTMNILDRLEETKKVMDYRFERQLEYDYYRNKIQKLVDEGCTDPEMLQRNQEKLAERKQLYEEANARATAICQDLAGARYKMFDYSFYMMMQAVEQTHENMGRAVRPLRKYEDNIPEKFQWSSDSTIGREEIEASQLRSKLQSQIGSPSSSTSSSSKKPSESGFMSSVGKMQDNAINMASKTAGDSLVDGVGAKYGVDTSGALGSAAKGVAASGIKAKITGGDPMASAQAEMMSQAKGAVRGAMGKKRGVRSIALYSYDAQEDNEISMVEGDVVWVQGDDEGGWTAIETGDGHGLVPTSYLQTEEAPPSPRRRSPSPPPRVVAPALPKREVPSLPPKDAGTPPMLPTRPKTVEAKPVPSAPPAEDSTPTPPPRSLPQPPAKAQSPVTATPVVLKPSSAVKPVQAMPTPPKQTASVGACGSCSCDNYLAHPFKKGVCSNCFHSH